MQCQPLAAYSRKCCIQKLENSRLEPALALVQGWWAGIGKEMC